MSEIPLTFTSEEQVKLNELDRQIQAFQNFGNVVARSLYVGQDAFVVQQLLQFFQEVMVQSKKQVDDIKAVAAQRTQPQVEEKK